MQRAQGGAIIMAKAKRTGVRDSPHGPYWRTGSKRAPATARPEKGTYERAVKCNSTIFRTRMLVMYSITHESGLGEDTPKKSLWARVGGGG